MEISAYVAVLAEGQAFDKYFAKILNIGKKCP